MRKVLSIALLSLAVTGASLITARAAVDLNDREQYNPQHDEAIDKAYDKYKEGHPRVSRNKPEPDTSTVEKSTDTYGKIYMRSLLEGTTTPRVISPE
jgi:hypothetical protein